MKLIRRIIELYRNYGIDAVGQAALRYGRYTIRDSAYQSVRIDNENRWRMIESVLDTNDTTVIDIGCAEGYFTVKCAAAGLLSLGIDIDEDRLKVARRKYGGSPGVSFTHWQLTPETIEDLFPADVYLLLSVYHHWHEEFGEETAEEMLRILGERSSKIVFEPPGQKLDRPTIDGYDGDSVKDYYRTLLVTIFNEQITVNYLGEAAYSGTERRDPVFLIQCDSYSRPDQAQTPVPHR